MSCQLCSFSLLWQDTNEKVLCLCLICSLSSQSAPSKVRYLYFPWLLLALGRLVLLLYQILLRLGHWEGEALSVTHPCDVCHTSEVK